MPQQVATQPAVLKSKAVTVVNNGDSLVVSLLLASNPAAEVTDALIVQATLDGTPTQVALPWYIGNLRAVKEALGASNGNAFGLSFPVKALSPSPSHTLQIRGTCRIDSRTQSFFLSAELAIPPVIRMPFSPLSAKLDAVADEAAGLWTYTVHNDEAPGSNQMVSNFQLRFDAPFVVRGTPPGWTVQTDNISFVLWSVTDQRHQTGHHVEPGKSLGGFQIQSASRQAQGAGYSLNAWDTASDKVGRMATGTVLVPGRQ